MINGSSEGLGSKTRAQEILGEDVKAPHTGVTQRGVTVGK